MAMSTYVRWAEVGYAQFVALPNVLLGGNSESIVDKSAVTGAARNSCGTWAFGHRNPGMKEYLAAR
jgi:hypothetical protein